MREILTSEIGYRFIILSVLGKGSFSKVFESINMSSRKLVALKVIKKYKVSQKILAFLENESRILEKLSHPNIVKYYASYSTKSFFIIEMEHLSGSSLEQLLSKQALDETQASIIMQSIFRAVSYMHKLFIIHRDLKPENIIFADESLESLKIVDFGLSAEFQTDYKLSTKTGTLIYMAPELIISGSYTERADIWSCGIILYKIITTSHPLYIKGESFEEYAEKIRNVKWNLPKFLSGLSVDLFLRCVKVNPIERYTASLALKHPWITRESTKIPLTHLEEIRNYQDNLKIKTMLVAAVYLSFFKRNCPKEGIFTIKITKAEDFVEPKSAVVGKAPRSPRKMNKKSLPRLKILCRENEKFVERKRLGYSKSSAMIKGFSKSSKSGQLSPIDDFKSTHGSYLCPNKFFNNFN